MPHIHDKIDFTAEVFIVYKNKVLLRKHDKYRLWLSVGGHVELDEDPNQAAIREAKEEVGLDIELYNHLNINITTKEKFSQLIPPMFMNRHNVSEDHEHVTLVFFATSKTDKLVLSDSEVSEECKWFTKEDLEREELTENVKYYAKAALDELGA